MTETTIRTVSLLFPVAITLLALVVVRPGPRTGAGLLLAFLWNLVFGFGVNALAVRLGWWSFHAEGALVFGVPIDLLIGWAVLWGPLPAIVFRRWPVWVAVVALFWIDLVAMPYFEPVVMLGDHWLIGEAAAVALALIPGLYLARWTAERTHLRWRASMQAILSGLLLFVVVPGIILIRRDTDWLTPLIKRPHGFLSIEIQLLLLPMILGLAAAQEFVERGQGTPLPWDPPQSLVRTGPYAYVANPMNLCATIAYPILGWVVRDPVVALAGLMAPVYWLGIVQWHERETMPKRYGPGWRDYRAFVRAWRVRWRPAYSNDAPVGRLYVGDTCEVCDELRRWLMKRSPVGLDIQPASIYPGEPLKRLTYVDLLAEDSMGREWKGVAAWAHAIEHLHFGWAFLGWGLRLPLVLPAVQLLIDATGGEARTLPGGDRTCAIDSNGDHPRED